MARTIKTSARRKYGTFPEQAQRALDKGQETYISQPDGKKRSSVTSRAFEDRKRTYAKRAADPVAREKARLRSVAAYKLPRVKKLGKLAADKLAKHRARPGLLARCERAARLRVNVTAEDLKFIWPVDGKCPGCGEVMLYNFEDVGNSRYGTVDRFVSGSVYTLKEIQWLCVGCNCAKGMIPWVLFKRVCPASKAACKHPWSSLQKNGRTIGRAANDNEVQE